MSLYYLLYFSAVAVFAPYFNLYLTTRGLSSSQVGTILAVLPFVGLLVQPLWGLLNDWLRLQKATVYIGLIVSPLLVLTFPYLHGFTMYLVVVAILAVFQTGVIPVMDSLTVEGAGVRDYGKVRMFGSLGYAIVVSIAGSLYRGGNVNALVPLYAITSAIALIGLALYPSLPTATSRRRRHKDSSSTDAVRDVIAAAVPDKTANDASVSHQTQAAQPNRVSERTDRSMPQNSTTRQPALLGVRRLLKNRMFMWLLVFTMLVSVSSTLNSNFFTLYYHAMNRPLGVLGVIYSVGALSEIPLFFVSGRLIAKFGAERMLLLASSVFLFRWVVLAFGPPTWVLFGLQLLHGLSFGVALAAGVSVASRVSDETNRVTAQTVYSAVNTGLAAIIGSMVGGVVLQSFGPYVLYGFAAVVCSLGVIGMVVLLFLMYRDMVNQSSSALHR